MLDGVTASRLPELAPMVAGYLPPSPFAWSAADWGRFPGSQQVRIQISSKVNSGDVLDVEQGDAPPSGAPGWVVMRRAAGHPGPTVYCNTSTWPSVRGAFVAAGVAEPNYWVAQYDGDPTIPAGAVAKQYAADAGGGAYDISSVAPYWPGIDPPPAAPTSLQEDTMPTLAVGQMLPGFACDPGAVVVAPQHATMIATPPADSGALPWGDMWLSLGCDFGTAHVRVAVHDGKVWSFIETVTLNPADPRKVVAKLAPNTGKISLCRVPAAATDTADWVPVAWLIEAGARAV